MAKSKKKQRRTTGDNSLIIVSDTHCGCGMGLCPPDGATLDIGGVYEPSVFQKKVWSWWEEFWGQWVPEVTRGEPYSVVFNGDAIDGVHHNSVTQITHNLEDQVRLAAKILASVVAGCDGRYYHIRGTEAHVGKSAMHEEQLAKMLGAIRNKEGQSARYDLWKNVAGGSVLVHLMHHVGSTGSMAYETTAVMKELVESYSEAGRWNRRPPDIIVRSHRHRNIDLSVPTHNTRGRAIVTPAWQGKTPFAWKIPGARQSEPQFGGCLVRMSEEGEWYVRHFVKSLERSEPE